MLSEISHSKKDKYHVISLMWNLRYKTDEQKEREAKNNMKTERETNHKTLSNSENKLRVACDGP